MKCEIVAISHIFVVVALSYSFNNLQMKMINRSHMRLIFVAFFLDMRSKTLGY